MGTNQDTYSHNTNRIRKIARIWSLVIFVFALIILIAEILGTFLNPGVNADYPWYENLIPFSLFLGVIGLVLAWRWEAFGSILSILCVTANYIMYIAFGGQGRGLLVVPLILLPVLISAILFLTSWWRTERISDPQIA